MSTIEAIRRLEAEDALAGAELPSRGHLEEIASTSLLFIEVVAATAGPEGLSGRALEDARAHIRTVRESINAMAEISTRETAGARER